MAVRAEYDDEAGALYLYLNDLEVARTEDREDEGYAVDLDANGVVVGIEVLDPARMPGLRALSEQWGFEDIVDEAFRAAKEAWPVRTYAVNSVQAITSVVTVSDIAAAVVAGSAVSGLVGSVPSQAFTFGDPARQAREPEPV